MIRENLFWEKKEYKKRRIFERIKFRLRIKKTKKKKKKKIKTNLKLLKFEKEKNWKFTKIREKEK